MMMKNIRKRLTYFLPALIVLMIIGLVLSRIHQPESSVTEPEVQITADEAHNHIGRAAEVCGKVASADYSRQIGGRPTFLNFGQPHPDQLFTAVIWGDNRPKWPNPPEKHYLDRKICITGQIEMHEGTPQIVVHSPNQIKAQ